MYIKLQNPFLIPFHPQSSENEKEELKSLVRDFIDFLKNNTGYETSFVYLVHICKHIELDEVQSVIHSDWLSYSKINQYAELSHYYNEVWKPIVSDLSYYINSDLEKGEDFNSDYYYVINNFLGDDSFYLVEKSYSKEFYVHYFEKVVDKINDYFKEPYLEESIKTNGWSLRQRFELLSRMNLLKVIQTQDNLLEGEKHLLVSYLLNCSLDNARKLYSGTYNKGKVDEAEINSLLKNYKFETNKK